jgi:hypothetical protein
MELRYYLCILKWLTFTHQVTGGSKKHRLSAKQRRLIKAGKITMEEALAGAGAGGEGKQTQTRTANANVMKKVCSDWI